MNGYCHAENYKDCKEVFPVINNRFLICKQLSTQGVIMSSSLNNLDIKNKISMIPQALAQGHYNPGPSSF